MLKPILFFIFSLFCFPFFAFNQVVTNTSCDKAIELFCGQATDVSFVHRDSSVWFQIEGTGDIIHASLCNYTPNITIFEGSCDSLIELNGKRGRLEYFYYLCENSSDEVGFKSEVGKTYYLRCNTLNPHLASRMNITCSTPATNNFCEMAMEISIGDTIKYNHLQAYPSKNEACDHVQYYERFDADTWYKFEGTGELLKLEDFDIGRSLWLSVLKGNCDEYECITPISLYKNKPAFQTELGNIYYVQILGVETKELAFQFSVVEPLNNDDCSDAIPFNLIDTLTIDLKNVKQAEVGCFPYSLYYDIWYSFIGTGEILDINALNAAFGGFMDVEIIKGNCDSLECEIPTKTNSNRIFQSEAGTPYLLQVHNGNSINSDHITQQIAVSSYSPAPNDKIEDAIELSCNDTFIGTLKGALYDEISEARKEPTVWYKVTGTDDFFSINTRYIYPDNENFGPRFSYYKKQGAELVWAGSAYSPLYLEQDSLIYIAVVGDILSVDFEISRTCPMSVNNDNCQNAILITLNDTIATNTTFAITGNGDGCNNSSRPGLWYQIEGKGELVDFYFEKQPNGHEFTINKGDCDSLICVERLFEFRHNDLNITRVFFLKRVLLIISEFLIKLEILKNDLSDFILKN